MRRGDLAGRLPVAGEEHAPDVAGRGLAAARRRRACRRSSAPSGDRTRWPGSRSAAAPSLVDLDATGPASTRRTSDGSGSPSSTLGRRQNDVKSCSPISGSQRRLHRPQRQRLGHEPRPAGEQRVGCRRVPDVVAVLAASGPRTGRRSRSAAHSACAHGDGRRTQLVQPPGEVVEVGVGRQVARHDLAPGVDAGVGAPGTGQLDRLAHDRRDRVRQSRRSPCARRGSTRTRGTAPRRRRLRAWTRHATLIRDSVVRDRPHPADAERQNGVRRVRCAPSRRCRPGGRRA